MSGNNVWLQTSGFQKLAKIDYFWHFSKMSTQIVNVARFARNIFCDFQTLCSVNSAFLSGAPNKSTKTRVDHNLQG